MKGTITRYRKKDGRVSWGYYYKAGEEQFTKSGYGTKDKAAEALEAAIAKEQGLLPAGHVAQPDTSPGGSKGDKRTLAEYLAYWLDTHAALRCAPTTMQLYRILAGYLVRHLGKIRLCDLKTARIQELVNHLRLRGGEPTKEYPDGRPLSAKYTHAIASLLHTCLIDAVRLEHLPANPMAARKVKLPKRVKRNPAVLDPSMLAKVFQVAEGTRAYPFIVTAASSGCRRGELCALTWSDVNFEKGSLAITKSLEQTNKGGLRLKCTKSGRPRFFGLDAFALEVLAAHREDQKQDQASFGRAYQNLDLVFCQPNGYYWSPNNIGLRVKELLVKAGLPGFTLHSLRHSHASVLLGQGAPLAVVSERLGHANQTVTLDIYSHALPADLKAASNVWHNALAEAIAEGRSRKSAKSLGKSRKLAVND
jgi:integrase